MLERIRRSSILIVVLSALFIGYIIYLFYLQVVQNYVYILRAEQVAIRTTNIPAVRGKIYDRNYDTPLVTNQNSFAIIITPAEVSEGRLFEVIDNLAELLNVEPDTLLQSIPERLYSSYSDIVLRNNISKKTILYIAENIQNYSGISWRPQATRLYPFRSQMSHILGYVGGINQSELERLFNEGYTANSTIGKSGIELQYDKVLRGEDGLRIRKVDARGRQVEENTLKEISAQSGKNLVLTIDRKVQELASKALGERTGSVVILKPTTGEILALVSYPTYDPNIFVGGLEIEQFNQLTLDSRSPFLNRSIQSVASPASTFKIVMSAALIEEQAIPLEQTILCTGAITFGDREFQCWLRGGHGRETFYEALADSCNVYFYTVGVEHLGADTIIDYANGLGLGQRTGVDLPGESVGLIPSPEWKEEIFGDVWRVGDTANLSIGQGYIQTTPIQMATLMSMIVNDGVAYRPHLLAEIRDPVTGVSIEQTEKTVAHERASNNNAYATLRRALRGVITDGTAKVVMTTRSVDIAGKTGTGQVSFAGDRYDSWFVAYAPYETDDPDERVVVLVMVDSNNEWEWWAPKAANIIFHGLFTDQDYEATINDLKKKGLLWYM